jgi:AraC family transcriptional regulator
MAIASRLLASGAGWSVSDVVCDSGPRDRPFEEQHRAVSIALVMAGTFQYRTTAGSALLAPGAVLLGNHGSCFECGHDHGQGDRCLALHFAPELFERIVAETPCARRAMFNVPRLPPLPELASLIARAEEAREDADADTLEEILLGTAGTVITALANTRSCSRQPRWEEERRVSAALRRIEVSADEPLSLARLAAEARMSSYHFLRVFRRVAGITPHQFLLSRRLHTAARRLRSSEEPISTIAFDAGFGDLSTFNRRFRRVMRVTPSEYRAHRAR